MRRRDFLKTAAAAGIAPLIMPGVRLFGADAASNKLNIALIGSWGRGEAHFGPISSENVVAICDINEEHMVGAAEKFPKATKYTDWRKCLEQKDINAVVISTTDFTHAFVANWALNRGYHVYCEKPLGNTVEEVRTVRANYLKNKSKLCTQVGTQRHELENFNRVQELIRDGAIGELTDAYAWGNRQIRRPGYLPAEGTPPANLHYDLWLGPIATDHPYNPGYFSGGPGANMGSHTMDLVWDAVEAGLPTSAEGKGQDFNPAVTPVELETHFDFPANSWRGPIKISWYQGGLMPRTPKEYVDLKKIDHGAMFKGTKGFLVCNFDSRIILPIGKETDMTYYKPRPKDKVLPAIGNFQKEWINGCKGNLKTSCDMEYSGNCIEMMLLGMVAYRVGKKLEYDGATGQVKNSPEANALLGKKYRQGWTLNG
jgi:predicted dehydrogenase